MDSERFKTIEEIFRAAQAQPAEARAAFLADACIVDPAMRHEVELLLHQAASGVTVGSESRPVSQGTPPGARGGFVGRTLGAYDIHALLGTGGMGEVYRARDTKLNRDVALKILPESFTHDAERLTRFKREAQVLAALNHPNIVTIHSIEHEADVPFLTMELVEGKLFSELIPKHGLAIDTILRIAIPLADAISAAHQRGITHRDLKPANVMVNDEGRLKVLDFGLAKLREDYTGVSGLSEAATGPITSEGHIVGTVAYMSPEQAEGKSVDYRSDIFSAGVMLYEMATGERPFKGDTSLAVLSSVLRDTPPLVTDVNGALPGDLARIVRRCLIKDPEQRYQSAKDLRIDLEELKQALTAREAAPIAAATPSRWATRLAVAAAGLVVMAACTLVFLYLTSASLEATDSVMVLPFTNVQNDTNVEYIADGLSESLTNTLSRLPTVRVIARTTAFGYKGRQIDVRALGRELNVRAVVTGRVSGTNERLRVQADLVDASAGTQLWGKQYEGKPDDMLQIQEDVVRNVIERLRWDVSEATQRQLTRAPTTSPEAYELYLRGRHALSRSTVADTQKGIEFFQKALELDPAYALAYTGLADSYLGLSGMHLVPRDAMVKARAAAKHAVELDSALPEGHVSMGVTQMYYDYAWHESEEQFKRAINLNPFEPSVRLWYGWNLVLRGNHRAGIAQAQRAHELDPLSSFVETGLAQMHYFAGQPEVAIQRLRSVVGADAGFFNGHYYLGVAYLYAARYTEAIQELEQASRLDPQQAQPIGYMAYAYGKLGDTRSAELRLSELKKLSESRYVSRYVFAVALVGMSAKEEAIQSLQKAYDDRDDMLTLVKVDSLLDDLRVDLRFLELLQRMRLD